MRPSSLHGCTCGVSRNKAPPMARARNLLRLQNGTKQRIIFSKEQPIDSQKTVRWVAYLQLKLCNLFIQKTGIPSIPVFFSPTPAPPPQTNTHDNASTH